MDSRVFIDVTGRAGRVIFGPHKDTGELQGAVSVQCDGGTLYIRFADPHEAQRISVGDLVHIFCDPSFFQGQFGLGRGYMGDVKRGGPVQASAAASLAASLAPSDSSASASSASSKK